MVDHTGVWVKGDLRTGGEGGEDKEEEGAFWDPQFRFFLIKVTMSDQSKFPNVLLPVSGRSVCSACDLKSGAIGAKAIPHKRACFILTVHL